MTNREYMIKSLSEPDWIDDCGADYEAMIYYNIKCPYFAGDKRCHCIDLKPWEEFPKGTCFECKEEWLDNEVDV